MGREIVYCDVCGVQVPGEDFVRGRAVAVAGKNYCAKCKAKAPAAVEPVGAGQRNATTTPRPITRGPGTGHSTPHPPLRRPPTDFARPGTRTMAPVPPKKSKAPLFIGLGVLVLVIIIVIAFAASGKGNAGGKGGGAASTSNTSSTHNPPPPPPPPNGTSIRPGEIGAKAVRDCWAESKAGKHSAKVCKDLLDRKYPEIDRTSFQSEIDRISGEITAAIKKENAAEAVGGLLAKLDEMARDMNPSTFGSLKNTLNDAYTACGDYADLRSRVDAKKAEIGKKFGAALADRAKEEMAKIDQALRDGSKYGALDMVNDFLGGLATVEELFPPPAGLKGKFEAKAKEIEDLIKKDDDTPHVKPPDVPEPPDPPKPEPVPTPVAKLPEEPIPATGKWTALFNGKDLKGWAEALKGGATWSVEDGAIVAVGPAGTADPGKASGLLSTTSTGYGDFEVEMELEVVEGVGLILLRGQEPGDKGVPGIGVPLKKMEKSTVFIRVEKGEITVDVKGGDRFTQKLSEIGEVPERGRIMIGVSNGSTIKLHALKVRPQK